MQATRSDRKAGKYLFDRADHIRRATTEDAERLGVIGPRAYADAYAYLWDDADAYAAQLETFSKTAFENLIARTDARVWVADSQDGLIGFLSMIVGSMDPIEKRLGGAELPRIYLVNSFRGSGIGRRLLDAAIKQAEAESNLYLWLDVMASAQWARRSYQKWGFREIGSAVFSGPVKRELRDMVIMTKEISPS